MKDNNDEPATKKSYSIELIGGNMIGKTSILSQFCGVQNNSYSHPKLDIDYQTKTLKEMGFIIK